MAGKRPLSSWELGWAVAAFGGLFPRGAHPLLSVGIEDTEIAPPLQALLAAAPSHAVWGVRAALVMCTLAPLFLLKRFTTLGRLDAAEKTLVMGTLLSSPWYPVRQLALLLKMMGALLFARAPEVRELMASSRAHVPVPTESGPRLIDERELVRGTRRSATHSERDSERRRSTHSGRRIA